MNQNTSMKMQCLLYLHEKLAIAIYPNLEELLNKRSEMISKCRDLSKIEQLNMSLMLSNLLNLQYKMKI